MRRFALAMTVLLNLVRVSSAAMAADFAVSPSQPTYTINGVGNPTLTLTRGETYTFGVNAPGHPFYIKTCQAIGTACVFNTGVTNNGATSNTLTFRVPSGAPDVLFYQCSLHSSMTGTLQIVSPVPVPGVRPAALGILMALFLFAGLFVALRRFRRTGAGSKP